jgi:hypothetical protein
LLVAYSLYLRGNQLYSIKVINYFLKKRRLG